MKQLCYFNEGSGPCQNYAIQKTGRCHKHSGKDIVVLGDWKKIKIPRCTGNGRLYWIHVKCNNPFPACVHIEQRNRMSNLWDIIKIVAALKTDEMIGVDGDNL
jgi:hypothetical protein